MRRITPSMIKACSSDVLSEEEWGCVLVFLEFAQDVARMMMVSKRVGRNAIHFAFQERSRLKWGIKELTLSIASTLRMAHLERVWEGVRLVPIDRRNDRDEATHSEIYIFRDDPPFLIGRRSDNNFVETVSRFHMIVSPLSDPCQESCLRVEVTGKNGVYFRRREYEQGSKFLLRIGDEMEVVHGTGIWFKADYIA